MSLPSAPNQCLNCDEWFIETPENPGGICEDCRKLLKQKEKKDLGKEFFEKIQKLY